MSAHTPGPWEVTGAGPGLGVVATEHKFAPYWIASAVDNNNNPENEANARLIAASPTMHQALRVFIRAFELEHPGVENKDEDWVYDEHRSVGLAYLQARAAIAKATIQPLSGGEG